MCVLVRLSSLFSIRALLALVKAARSGLVSGDERFEKTALYDASGYSLLDIAAAADPAAVVAGEARLSRFEDLPLRLLLPSPGAADVVDEDEGAPLNVLQMSLTALLIVLICTSMALEQKEEGGEEHQCRSHRERTCRLLTNASCHWFGEHR